MSPLVRRITIEGPGPGTGLLLAIVMTTLIAVLHNAIIGPVFKPEVHDPAPCKLFSTEKPNQCPKWLATQFMRRAIDSQYRLVKGKDQCWHHNRNYMIDAFHKYYYVSDPFTVFAQYVANDMGVGKSADVMSLI